MYTCAQLGRNGTGPQLRAHRQPA